MRPLFASTCLTPIALLALAPVHAETLVDTKRTTAAATATIKSGAPDDLRITSAGSVVTTLGAAVTLNSANKVTNEGLVQVTDANGATGILAVAGTSGTIANSGKILIDETYAPTDADKDGDLDGAFAKGTGRTGIRAAGAFAGNVANTGTITIAGNDSAGIALDGPLTGSLINNGVINAVGDRVVGLRANAVSGSVRLAGSIVAQGKDAIAAAMLGNIGGGLVVQGSLSSTGYRSTTLPTDVSKLDADDLLQGGSALVVAGNVAGGIILALPPKDTDPKNDDEDKDGIPDATEGSAVITTYGSAPAVQIGAAARAVTVDAVAGSTYGLIIDGNVSGLGVYKDVNASGISIGGLGGAVAIAGGMSVTGSVQATSNNASATAIKIGAAATVPEIRIGGGVSAAGGGVATARSTGLAIDAGARVQTVRVGGQIKATAAAADGFATAILDKSGTLTLVENSGSISATGGGTGHNVAIDLRANTSGATVRQIAGATGAPAPSIAGDILLGSGSDTLAFGGKSSFSGTVDLGGGSDTLTLTETSRFTGAFVNSSALALNVASGTLALGTKGAVALGSLSLGKEGVLGITIDAAAKTNTVFQVAGNASFAAGSQVVLSLSSIGNVEGRYVIVKAGSLTGASNLASSAMQLPYLFKSSISASAANEVAVELKRKTAVELGLNGSQSIAYEAVIKALDNDAKVAGAFLDIGDGKRFGSQLRQMLPDHAGGVFEAVTQGSRATARILADPGKTSAGTGRVTTWLQQVAWGTSKDLKDTAAYDINGWGIAGGGELATAAGSFGLSAAFLNGKDADGGTDNEVNTGQYEAAATWRGSTGGFSGNARLSAAHIDLSGRRHFDGRIGSEAVSRTAEGDWNGRLLSASAGAAYEARFGRLSLRPIAAVDYYHLHEDAYVERGGGKAFNLSVDGRTSDELAVSGTVAAGLDFGGTAPDDGWLRVELEGGRRQIVGGSLGDTTAQLEGGKDFTLHAEGRTNGWVGKVRAIGGDQSFKLAAEFGAEQRHGKAAIAARASVTFAL